MVTTVYLVCQKKSESPQKKLSQLERHLCTVQHIIVSDPTMMQIVTVFMRKVQVIVRSGEVKRMRKKNFTLGFFISK